MKQILLDISKGIENTGAAMYVLYGIESLLVLGFVALILGVLWEIVFYPMKTVHYINEWGNPRTKRVPDIDYHYKPEELWEPPAYWKAWKVTNPEQQSKQ